MKQKKTLLWMVLAFIILIGGASVLYGKLGEAQAREQLAVISEEQFLAAGKDRFCRAKGTGRGSIGTGKHCGIF